MDFHEVKYQDPRTKTYLGTPGLLRLPGGDLLAKHDYFGPGCPRNMEGEEHLSSVYRSRDNGRSWETIAHLSGMYWAGLFAHDGAIYLLGTSAQYGHIVISRSEDEGYTWTFPRDERSGLLFRGGTYHDDPNYHTSSMPILEHEGRLYRAFEDCAGTNWPVGFQASVISIDAGADLLDASAWRMSNKLAFRDVCPKAEWDPDWKRPGWLEGNVLIDPGGRMWNLLRFNASPHLNRAALVRVEDQGRRASFDYRSDFIDMPGGHTKFVVRYDPVTKLYWTLSNNAPDPERYLRNRLSVSTSPDLRTWVERTVLLEDDLEPTSEASRRNTGFQYVDWRFDGEDLIYLVRTAYDGAHNFHDANRMTFHVLPRFRALANLSERKLTM